MPESKEAYATIIGADATFKGELTFDSSANVMGKIEGSITSKGKVHVSGGADCKATLKAKEVAVEGHIEGNVEAEDRVEILADGCITGDVIAARMNIAEGASINGVCRVGVNGAAKSKANSATEVKAEEPAKATTAAAARKR